MKYLLMACGLSCLFIGCKKEKEEPSTPDLNNGAVHATLNGQPWNVDGLAQRVFTRRLCDYDCLYIGAGIGDYKTFSTSLAFLNVRKEMGHANAP
jgi:hypothetical protein